MRLKLTEHQRKALEWVVNGGSLKATRVFPFPHRYGLYMAESPGIAIKEVGEATVRGLVEKGAVRPAPRDRMLWDTIVYELTEIGREAVA